RCRRWRLSGEGWAEATTWSTAVVASSRIPAISRATRSGRTVRPPLTRTIWLSSWGRPGPPRKSFGRNDLSAGFHASPIRDERLTANMPRRPPADLERDPPTRRAASTIGVMDIGSNTARCVVFDTSRAGSVRAVYQTKDAPRLGSETGADSSLSPEAMVRGVATVRRFARAVRALKVPKTLAVATSAVRDARTDRSSSGTWRGRPEYRSGPSRGPRRLATP